MSLKLYMTNGSPAVRATLFLIEALEIDIELVPINLMQQDQMKPEFLKMNPFHTVPTLKDGDFVIWDSHAINIYLLEKYGKNDSLYPNDPQSKAIINQRLFFHSGTLYPRVTAIGVSLLMEGAKSISKDKADLLTEAYKQLELLLERSTYVAGEKLSLADFSITATITNANVLVPIASNRFPKITEWIDRMKSIPYYKKANEEGLANFTAMVKSILA